MGSRQALDLRRTLEKIWSEVATRVPGTEAGALASAELALYAPAGPLRLAVDEHGHRHLLVPMAMDDETMDDWRSTGVQLRTSVKVIGEDPVRLLDLECRRDDLNGVFTGLVADVCGTVAYERGISGHRLSTMLESWRELLGGSRQAWTVPRLAGLYGELAVLELLLTLDPGATDTWVGPTGAAQDFRRHPHALEVKTTTAAVGRLIRIHGTDQLERPNTGFLGLVWSRFTALPRGEADDIPTVVERCLSLADSPSLLSRLDQIGLPSLSSAEVRDVSFELVERHVYDVDSGFPRITPDRFVGQSVPAGIQNVEYVVDLDTVPAMEEDLTTVVTRFVEAA
ncbi:PD-(D/E)XK motif protein [Micromonosporaceae bacterium Da 78-11]